MPRFREGQLVDVGLVQLLHHAVGHDARWEAEPVSGRLRQGGRVGRVVHEESGNRLVGQQPVLHPVAGAGDPP
jgi:hypothetical protein